MKQVDASELDVVGGVTPGPGGGRGPGSGAALPEREEVVDVLRRCGDGLELLFLNACASVDLARYVAMALYAKRRQAASRIAAARTRDHEESGCSHPSIAVDDDTIHMVYTGERPAPPERREILYNVPTICHATAPVSDPAHVTKNPANPTNQTDVACLFVC